MSSITANMKDNFLITKSMAKGIIYSEEGNTMECLRKEDLMVRANSYTPMEITIQGNLKIIKSMVMAPYT